MRVAFLHYGCRLGRALAGRFRRPALDPLVASLLLLIIITERRRSMLLFVTPGSSANIFLFRQTGLDPAAICLKGCSAVWALIRWPC
jgi:hypothetical protein